MIVKYPRLEVAGLLLGEIEAGIIRVKDFDFCKTANWMKGTFSIKCNLTNSSASLHPEQSRDVVGIYHNRFFCGVFCQ